MFFFSHTCSIKNSCRNLCGCSNKLTHLWQQKLMHLWQQTCTHAATKSHACGNRNSRTWSNKIQAKREKVQKAFYLPLWQTAPWPCGQSSPGWHQKSRSCDQTASCCLHAPPGGQDTIAIISTHRHTPFHGGAGGGGGGGGGWHANDNTHRVKRTRCAKFINLKQEWLLVF